MARDHLEQQRRTLNSVIFPESHGRGKDKELSKDKYTGNTNKATKKELFWISEYARDFLHSAMSRLDKEIEKAVIDPLRVFIDLTDLYGKIDVA